MTFSIKGDSFYLNDKKVFLNSGEIHYFRIKRDLWDKHLEAAKEAGLTTVSTYVPGHGMNQRNLFLILRAHPVRNAILKVGFSDARITD
jgi:hypothetical protein